MILTGCYMHCRRRFVEAVLILKLNDLTDDQIRTLPEVKAVALIAEIYIADHALKEMSADKLSQLPDLDQKKTVYPVVSSRIILT